MYNKRSIGTENEQKAVNYLKQNGYQILATNFFCRAGEIDIIAKDSKYLVFIEVKYRKDTGTGEPLEAVNYRKMRNITRSARYYMHKNYISEDTPCRFDVVSILKDNIQLIKNAFDAVMD